MTYVSFFLIKIVVYSISYLPFWVLYRISDILYVVTYYGVGYRKKVVFNNLKNAFPDTTDQYRTRVAKQYYRHFCDLLVEGIKLLTISKNSLQKRFTFKNLELLDHYYEKKQSVIGVVGHYGNWEWGGLALSLKAQHQVLSIYKPFSHPYFDRLMKKVRGKFGAQLVPMNQTARAIVEKREQNIPTITMLISDQTPSNPNAACWTQFLNQDTLVFLGAEKLAYKYDMPVIFCHIRKKDRGYYETEFTTITEKPRKQKKHAITHRHTKMLEQVIQEHPPYWLWSHRRWKHTRPA